MPSTPPPLPGRPSRYTHKIRVGQKCLIYAILINVVVLFLVVVPKRGTAAEFFAIPVLVLGLASPILSITGVLTLGAGLRYGIARRIACALLMLVPVGNLVTLLVLNNRAISALRRAGYKVGFLGAKSLRRSSSFFS